MSQAEKITVCVGCAPNYEDAESQAVLEWSLRKHSSLPIDIRWMRLSNDPASPFNGWNTHSWATPFSGFRWCVAELNQFQGRAIYMDSDFIVLADIAELWQQEFQPGKVVMGKAGNWRLCMSLWDCSAAKGRMIPISALKGDGSNHQKMASRFCRNSGMVQPFEGDWNNLDARNSRSLYLVKALHYTRMATQPQLEYAIPRLQKAGQRHWFDGRILKHPRADVRALFKSYLTEAIENGYTVEKYTTHEPYGPIMKQRFAGRGM